MKPIENGGSVTPGAFDGSRRRFALTFAAVGSAGVLWSSMTAKAAVVSTDVDKLPPYGNGTLPNGIRSRVIPDVNGLSFHILESGYETPGRPALLLLHGFPELSYSWRKVMVPLASVGFHVIAPDRRGYGRTTGWDDAYDTDLQPFGMLNRVTDAVALASALGYRSVAAVIGHDWGSQVAAWCALARPDTFRSVVMMSSPFPGPPALPFDTASSARAAGVAGPPDVDIDAQLAALRRPRKYYVRYFTTREANRNLQFPPQGLHEFMRAYFHFKSADWKGNAPFPLKARTAEELAKLPTYYVMDLDKGMAETVASEMPSAPEVAACRWLTEDELAVYTSEYGRTGFQGGLQEYRCVFDEYQNQQLQLFSGRTIDVPSLFIGGKADWGVFQNPGALDTMRSKACTRMQDVHLVENAGHWVQQEQPGKTVDLLIRFLTAQTRS